MVIYFRSLASHRCGVVYSYTAVNFDTNVTDRSLLLLTSEIKKMSNISLPLSLCFTENVRSLIAWNADQIKLLRIMKETRCLPMVSTPDSSLPPYVTLKVKVQSDLLYVSITTHFRRHILYFRKLLFWWNTR